MVTSFDVPSPLPGYIAKYLAPRMLCGPPEKIQPKIQERFSNTCAKSPQLKIFLLLGYIALHFQLRYLFNLCSC